MGPFSVVILTACLNIFRWLLWLVAILLILLMIKQKLTGDPELRPVPQVLAITAFILAGYASAWASRRVLTLLTLTKNKSDS